MTEEKDGLCEALRAEWVSPKVKRIDAGSAEGAAAGTDDAARILLNGRLPSAAEALGGLAQASSGGRGRGSAS